MSRLLWRLLEQVSRRSGEQVIIVAASVAAVFGLPASCRLGAEPTARVPVCDRHCGGSGHAGE